MQRPTDGSGGPGGAGSAPSSGAAEGEVVDAEFKDASDRQS